MCYWLAWRTLGHCTHINLTPLYLWMFLDSYSIFRKPENDASDKILDALSHFSAKEGT
jgi:hypothetical protein